MNGYCDVDSITQQDKVIFEKVKFFVEEKIVSLKKSR